MAKRPIFDSKVSYSSKLLRIVRDQRHAEAAGMCGYEEVICANQLAGALEVGTYLCVVLGGLIRKIQYLGISQERIECLVILLAARRYLYPV